MSNKELARHLGRKHCRLGRIPSMGMLDEYYEGYSEELDKQPENLCNECLDCDECEDRINSALKKQAY